MQRIKTAIVVSVILISSFPAFLFSQTDTLKLNFFGVKPLKGDSSFYIDIFRGNILNWNVKIISKKGKTTEFNTKEPDSLDLSDDDIILLTTLFKVNPLMSNQIYGLRYDTSGSEKLEINNKRILETGIYCKDKPALLSDPNQKEFLYFYLEDTLVSFRIECIRKSLPGLSIGHLKWVQEERKKNMFETRKNYSIGFYYLSFAIIFLIFFLFFKAKKENLYFALFCVFISANFLTDSFTYIPFLDQLNTFSIAFAAEFLSFFFARVMINKEKSKVPIIIFSLVALISIVHEILKTIWGIFNENYFDIVIGVSVGLFIAFAIFSCLFYWLQGFGQKKWESKIITYGILLGFIVYGLIPIILALIPEVKSMRDSEIILDIISGTGLCIYPLTVAIVLGRRNALNQKQLINQVHSIEKLSKENLEKETEKKKILEEQNVQLEEKVAHRTHELEVKNNLISIKNKEITDSLIYAKRIQSAILPDIKLIYKTLEQSFILFMPKDIVSGDFYGFVQKNNKVIITAADCTGHGVAGAFMSMIGSSLLNHIIIEKNITTPAMILDELNEGIISSLKQKDSESNDGMDISICAFDLVNYNVEFAGANRPLWIIRNNEIMNIKPDKLPIGGLQISHDAKYTNHEIALQKNDTLYLFSDGYADQFGGEKGKKLMTKKFRETLLSIQNLTMREQEIHLRNLFENWRGNMEQVDDVLVIGIRV